MRFVCLALLASALFVSIDARADATAEAEALITKGVELREKGKDDEALGLFKQAFAKAPSARARAQVALAEQALGMWVAAENDLAAALAMDDSWIAKNKTALEGALAVIRKHLATLEVRGAEKAEVFLDGVKIGTGAGPYRVEAGRRTLEVRAAGFHPTSRPVDIPVAGIARENVSLVASTQPEPGRPPVNGEAPDEDRGSGQRLIGWAFAGTGAALLATGGVSLFVRKGIVDDYNVLCPGLGAAQSGACTDQASSAQTWLTVAIITFVGGGVFAAGGVVLVLAAPSATPKKKVGFGCAPTLNGMSCSGTF